MHLAIDDHCQTAADVRAAARRAYAFRHDVRQTARRFTTTPASVILENIIMQRVAEETAKARAEEREAVLQEIEARRLADEAAKPHPVLTMHLLIEFAAKHFGVSSADLCSERRFITLTKPRQCVFWCARKLLNRSLPNIGRSVGGRDHTTVLHGIRVVSKSIEDGGELGERALAFYDAVVAKFETGREAAR